MIDFAQKVCAKAQRTALKRRRTNQNASFIDGAPYYNAACTKKGSTVFAHVASYEAQIYMYNQRISSSARAMKKDISCLCNCCSLPSLPSAVRLA